MSFQLCGQHLLLPIVTEQFEDQPIAQRLKRQDRRDPSEMPIRQCSASEVNTGSQTGLMPEDDIVEPTSIASNLNKGQDDIGLTPPLGVGTTAEGGDDNGDDCSSSSEVTSRGSSVHSLISI